MENFQLQTAIISEVNDADMLGTAASQAGIEQTNDYVTTIMMPVIVAITQFASKDNILSNLLMQILSSDSVVIDAQ